MPQPYVMHSHHIEAINRSIIKLNEEVESTRHQINKLEEAIQMHRLPEDYRVRLESVLYDERKDLADLYSQQELLRQVRSVVLDHVKGGELNEQETEKENFEFQE